jgi:hypothetical protein
MPLAELFVADDAAIDVSAVMITCQEIIPLALSTKKLPLNAGDIEFIEHAASDARLSSDLLVVVSAYPSRRRWKERGARARLIKQSLQDTLGPEVTVNVALKFDLAYWVESGETAAAEDMALVIEARERIAARRALETAPDPEAVVAAPPFVGAS